MREPMPDWAKTLCNLGDSGCGKSTLLSLVSGAVQPSGGRIKRGKTVKISVLTQQLDELKDVLNDRVSAVVATKRSTYLADGKEMTPGQLLERLGFTSAQLSTPVKDLSGGQKRRLQLLLILLDEPNVLILDEPTNDLDTDMLVAMEDLLDAWPGTLLVITHDRYLLERITDQQYAVLDGHLRHLPGGVDQYLQLRAGQSVGSVTSASSQGSGGSTSSGISSIPVAKTPKIGGAELRNAEKELGAIERKLAKLQGEEATIHERLAAHDQSDFEGLTTLSAELRALEAQVADLETRWLEVTALIEG